MASREAFGGDVSWAEHWIVPKGEGMSHRRVRMVVALLAAPIGFISGPALAAAVSNAGGLGIMSFSANPPSVLRDEIRYPVVSNEQALRQ